MSTIQETIDRLRELDQNASPAPWLATHSDYLETVEDGGVVIEGAGGEVIAEADVDLGHHSFFINDALPLMVELRNALPVLLTEIERLTTENKKLSEAWEGGYKTAANLYYEWPSKPEDFAQEAHALSPYKESKK